MSSPTDILVWPDCTICYLEDLTGMDHMSDDYRIITDPHPIGLQDATAEHLYVYFWSYLQDCSTDPLNFNPDYQGV